MVSIFGLFDFDPSGFDPVRQDSAVLVVSRRLDLSSKRSNPRAAKQVRSVFFYVCILQSIEENEGK